MMVAVGLGLKMKLFTSFTVLLAIRAAAAANDLE
jgi:hypothetical protein